MPVDRRRLEAITRDRNAAQKHAWRSAIVLLSADGVGANELMRRTGKSKTCVWRWQARFMQEGVDGLLHDKTRPSRISRLGPEVAERVVALTNARFLKDLVYEQVAASPAVEHVVLLCSAVNAIDMSALESLELAGTTFLAHLTGQVFLSQHQAMKSLSAGEPGPDTAPSPVACKGATVAE